MYQAIIQRNIYTQLKIATIHQQSCGVSDCSERGSRRKIPSSIDKRKGKELEELRRQLGLKHQKYLDLSLSILVLVLHSFLRLDFLI